MSYSASKNGLQRSSPPVFIPLCSLLQKWIGTGLCNQSGGDLAQKARSWWLLPCSLLDLLLRGKLATMLWGHSISLMEKPLWTEVKPSGQEPVHHTSEPWNWASQKLILQLQSNLPVTVAPFDCNYQVRTAFQATPESLTNRNCERQ